MLSREITRKKNGKSEKVESVLQKIEMGCFCSKDEVALEFGSFPRSTVSSVADGTNAFGGNLPEPPLLKEVNFAVISDDAELINDDEINQILEEDSDE